METDTRFVYPENARSGPYKEQLDEIAAAGVCPFCPENLFQWKREPILREGTYWRVSAVDWQYEGALGHFILIARNHITKRAELVREAKLELFELAEWLDKEFGLRHGTLLIRDGGALTGQTVAHLHAQIIAAGDKPIVTRV